MSAPEPAEASEIGRLLHALRLPESARRPPPQSLTGAAVEGDLDMVVAFLEGGASVEERSIGFASPLQAAAGAGRLAAVELLLARGADPREKPDAVYSPLSAAAMKGHRDIVRRLVEAGDLAALVDAEAVGRPLTAFVGIVLSSHSARVRFLRRVAALDAVQECHHVTGEFDYLLKLRCSDTRDLERIINDGLKSGAGVSGSRTLIVLSTAKETPRLPVVSR